MKCEEDDEFIAELERTMTSELTGRKMDSTVNKVNSSDLALPMNRGFKGMCLSLYLLLNNLGFLSHYTLRCTLNLLGG